MKELTTHLFSVADPREEVHFYAVISKKIAKW